MIHRLGVSAGQVDAAAAAEEERVARDEPPGLAGLLAVVVYAGRIRGRAGTAVAGSDRDDDRFWKGGLVYVNRDDPALMVNARFTFAWTPNLGNPRVWLIFAGVAAILAGLVALKLTVGL